MVAVPGRELTCPVDEALDSIDANGITVVDPAGQITLEILGEDDEHQRRTNSDSEILDRAQFLGQVINQPVTIVTADRGMRVRGRARNLTVRTLPDTYRLPLDDDDAPRTQDTSASACTPPTS
ncbi:hypothetical protein [Amycolatopsis sp. DG1A-15b]|uniref:hypothetical protein n=1 Tax=Amycolatopsis sp. DG1A-15b TaxID=3052846 RepID=UPI00255B6328|nr:hypothetical protein [Amycolatopsis sp. DG1A-15b]WIX92516.1 hypothetical protein QRY02_19585 [Amycolatopsis sp. DG1A-15b]